MSLPGNLQAKYKWQPSQIALYIRKGGTGKTQVGTDLGLHHLGNPRAKVPSGQLQTMQEYHHPVLAQLILHGLWRLVISGHSQSLQLTGLGKSLPLICQQQPRLNYKRGEYSAHTKSASRVPSLGDRGGCATGPYRTPTTLGHAIKEQLHLILKTNTRRLPK